MSKKKWEHGKCNVCLHYNPEYRQGVCSLYPYKKKKIVSDKEKLDTSYNYLVNMAEMPKIF